MFGIISLSKMSLFRDSRKCSLSAHLLMFWGLYIIWGFNHFPTPLYREHWVYTYWWLYQWHNRGWDTRGSLPQTLIWEGEVAEEKWLLPQHRDHKHDCVAQQQLEAALPCVWQLPWVPSHTVSPMGSTHFKIVRAMIVTSFSFQSLLHYKRNFLRVLNDRKIELFFWALFYPLSFFLFCYFSLSHTRIYQFGMQRTCRAPKRRTLLPAPQLITYSHSSVISSFSLKRQIQR